MINNKIDESGFNGLLGKCEMSKKKLMIFIILVLVLAFGCFLYHFRFYFIGTSSKTINAKDNSDFHIANIVSSIDMDQDGIDDQTDILQGARKYISTNPVYKSKYYDTGYPNDKYGVCTDVVANAMLNAGYDLQQLVNADIISHPDDYDIDEPDVNIDFRRVKNLKVYFKHTAISLTTDINEIEEWQGGDIVIFENHIGIVSDKRNDSGIPFIIHHNSPFQAAYEEDILAKRDDIV
jgi:uncharacterized protein YijF (DUF1287 family)